MVNNCRHTGFIADSVVVKVWWKVAYNHVAIFAPEVIVIHPKFSVILWRHLQELFYVIRHFLPFLSPTTATNFKSTCKHVLVYFNNWFVLQTLQVLEKFRLLKVCKYFFYTMPYPSDQAPFHSVSPHGFRTRINLAVPDRKGISSTPVIT